MAAAGRGCSTDCHRRKSRVCSETWSGASTPAAAPSSARAIIRGRCSSLPRALPTWPCRGPMAASTASIAWGFAPANLAHSVDNLRRRYDHVLVQTPRALAGLPWREVHLVGPDEPTPPIPRPRPGHTVRGWSEHAARGSLRVGPDIAGVLHVPPLREPDHATLREGWLPPTTPAGARLGWSARDLVGMKVGLALGGGGLKGYAHLGVLRVFERVGLGIDYLA